MNQRAYQAQTLDGAGRERAYLPVEGFAEAKLFTQSSDALRDRAGREVVQAAEEFQIFAAG